MLRRPLVLILFIVNSFITYAQVSVCEVQQIKTLLKNENYRLFYEYKDVPKSIRKYLNRASREKVSFSTIKRRNRKTNKFLRFIFNKENDWLVFYTVNGGRYCCPAYILQVKLDENNKVCHLSNFDLDGKIKDFNSLKAKILGDSVKISIAPKGIF